MELMHYLTKVEIGSITKHIVQVNGENFEITELGNCREPKHYGENYYRYGDFTVFKNLEFKYGESNSIHLAAVVFAIELTRFVLRETGATNANSK
ncbi:hypothetical protein VPHD81_0120 [Vibrio phage D81]